MLIKKPDGFKPSEITPEAVYLQRRAFIRGAGLGLGAMLLPGMGMAAIDANVPVRDITRYTGARQASTLVPDWLHKKVSQAQPSRHLAQEAVTSWDIVTTYNNYYEFGTDKGDPAENASDFRTESA
jgi:sulfoxide reductase catalytic subunit YedY